MTEFRLAAVLAVACLAVLHATGRLEFVRAELPGGRRWLGLALLFALLALAVFFPVASFGQARRIDPATVDFWSLFTGHLVLLAFLLTWWLLALRPPWRDYLSLPRAPLLPACWTGLVTGAAGWAVTLLVTATVAATATSLTESALAPREAPPVMLWLARLPAWRKIVIVGVAMTVEEAFFRGFLQRRLGLALSTILFTLAHFTYGLPLMVVAVFTISLILGGLFEYRRNLVSCVVAHGVFDTIQIFLIIPMAVRHLT